MKSRKRNARDYEVLRHEMRLLTQATPEQQRKAFENATVERLLKFDADFETWANDDQRPPNGEGWRTWLMMAGRGYGKTRAGAEWIHRLADGKREVRIALVGATLAEARSIMIEGVSGLLAVAGRYGRRLKWEPSLGRLTWPNKSQAELFSGDSADGLRGPEHDFAWCDELAKWRQAEDTWANVRFGLRRGPRPRALITTTPKTIPLLTELMADRRTVVTRGRTRHNINLDEDTIDMLTETYGGTRLGRQELDGELVHDAEGALWSRELIARSRCAEVPERFERVVIGVDPPGGSGPKCDACGIIVAGLAGGRIHVLADDSVRESNPEAWSARVALAAARWDTAQVVAEANNGGDMVRSVLLAADPALKVRLVHASRGKTARAEPVAVMFEKGRVVLAPGLGALEDELAGMVAGGDYQGPGRSPDRADAMVWAVTALSESRSGVPRVRGL